MTTFQERWGHRQPKPKPDQPGSDKPLQDHINWYVQQGYRIVSQTGESAQLVKPKEFSAGWAVFWFLFFGVGVLIYIFYYMGKKDQPVYLSVGADGKVNAS